MVIDRGIAKQDIIPNARPVKGIHCHLRPRVLARTRPEDGRYRHPRRGLPRSPSSRRHVPEMQGNGSREIALSLRRIGKLEQSGTTPERHSPIGRFKISGAAERVERDEVVRSEEERVAELVAVDEEEGWEGKIGVQGAGRMRRVRERGREGDGERRMQTGERLQGGGEGLCRGFRGVVTGW